MIPKVDSPPHLSTSYRPISLLTVMSKLFAGLFLSRPAAIVENNHLIPDLQFGFRRKRSTIDQVYWITEVIDQALEGKLYCPSVFLNISQAFDGGWNDKFIYKLKQLLPDALRNHPIISKESQIRSSPELRFLSFVRYFNWSPSRQYTRSYPLPFGHSRPTDLQNVTMIMFSDDTAVFSTHQQYTAVFNQLQDSVDKIAAWSKRLRGEGRIKLNEQKTVRVNFTRRPHNYEPTIHDNQIVPIANSASYLAHTWTPNSIGRTMWGKSAIASNLFFESITGS